MLIDKPYYDYDYEHVPPKAEPTDDTLWSDAKVESIFASVTSNIETESEKAERLQREANKQYKAINNG